VKISINWLKEYVETNSQPEEISEILTNLGLEVEGVENYESIKNKLISEGYNFKSQTDTEVLPHLFNKYIKLTDFNNNYYNSFNSLLVANSKNKSPPNII